MKQQLRPTQRPERCLLVDIIHSWKSKAQAEQELEEARHLVDTYGGIVIAAIFQRRSRPSAKTYLGEGKAQMAAELAKQHDVDLVIVNDFLKPAQSYHLSKLFTREEKIKRAGGDIKLWDRSDLIFKIFDKHAKSQIAKLQIRLAYLKHQIPKIYQYHETLFERERGGIRGTRGGGERGIEEEKRHIRGEIKSTEEKLEQMEKTGAGQRQYRKRIGLKTVALVGYTNAGKSTLLTALTGKEALAKDTLFSTLDTKLGALWLEDPTHPRGGKKILIADTIGFIQNLPPHLIQSFKATLKEVEEADLILHVIDASDQDQDMKIGVVDHILGEILQRADASRASPAPSGGPNYKSDFRICSSGSETLLRDISIIRVFNKNDTQNWCSLKQRGELTISAIDHKSLATLKVKLKNLLESSDS